MGYFAHMTPIAAAGGGRVSCAQVGGAGLVSCAQPPILGTLSAYLHPGLKAGTRDPLADLSPGGFSLSPITTLAARVNGSRRPAWILAAGLRRLKCPVDCDKKSAVSQCFWQNA